MATIEEFYGVSDETVKQAILWQYNNATNLQSLIDQKYTWLRGANDNFWCWFLFYYFYLGSTTSNDGVTIWSILLDYPVTSSLPPNKNSVWGFGADDVNFDNGGFGSVDHSIVSLPLAYAILCLQLRYFQLTTSGTVTQINAFMNYLYQYKDRKSTRLNSSH